MTASPQNNRRRPILDSDIGICCADTTQQSDAISGIASLFALKRVDYAGIDFFTTFSLVPLGFYFVGKHAQEPITAPHPALVLIALLIANADAIHGLVFARPHERPFAEHPVFGEQ
jgi:hypothetical protein